MINETFRRPLWAMTLFLVLIAVNDGMARGNWPDGPNKKFLENLERPDNYLNPHRDLKSRSCCGIADTVKTKFRVELSGGPYPEDIWYAWLDGKWIKIPPEKIVKSHAPDGQAFLFMLANTIQCFVKPKGNG